MNSLDLQPDGKIVSVGLSRTQAGSNYDFALARYNSNGSLDTGFGISGKTLTDLSGFDEAVSVMLANGKILVAGSANDDFILLRYVGDQAALRKQ